MTRKKGSKNKTTKAINDSTLEPNHINDTRLPKKSLFRIDEVAAYFDVSRSTIYLWVSHGILSAEKYNGTIRVPREAIINCRFKSRLDSLA